MAYTVTEAYNRILQEADKLGSDYFTLPDALKVFKNEVLSFVGARAKEAELNQEVKDDIRSLLVSKGIPFSNDPDVPKEKIAATPNDYLRMLSVNVLYNDGLKARQPTIERHGEDNTNNISPYRKPERNYPLIRQFSNYFNVQTNIELNATIQPEKLLLVYIKKPTFGVNGNDVVVDLPDDVCEYLFGETANHFRLNNGEPTAVQDFQINQLFRNK